MVRTAPSHEKYGKDICWCMQDFWSHKTPGMPKFLIMRPMIDSEKISAQDQQEYWLGLGVLL